MGVVKGAISIKDNMTAVLRSIKDEQTAFRKDVEKTKKALQSTWDQKRTARLDATAAKKAADGLVKKLEPLKKKVTTAVAVKDMATAKVKAVGNKVKAVGKMVATPLVKLKDGTAAGLAKITSGLKSVAKNVVIPVTIAASVATTAILGGAISQGAALEQSIGGVETLFKDSASVVKANADAAYKTAGLSSNAYMEQVTSFSASLLNSLKGDTAKAAVVADMAMVDMADNANKFGTSMESIQNAYQGFAKQNYTMLDNLKLGYGGTKEEMQRLLKDAQKLTGTKYNIDNLADVYSAIHAIQENLGVTGTTAKEASETFSGSFASMKAAAQNVLGNLAIGGDVTGSMKELVESASTFLFNNAVPMIGSVLSALPGAIKTGIKSAAPRLKTAGKEIIKSLKDGMISILPSSMGGVVNTLFDTLGNLGNGFAAILPQLASFGASVMTTLQQVATAVMPVVTTVVQTVQTVLPAILPVIGTVVSTIGNVISAAAPIIAGLVQGIGTVISALAPVFKTIFDGIGQKVGTVLSFVGSKMGWLQSVIETVAPVVADVLTTAWSVISPVMDIAISVFKVLFNVVQTVFNGIASVVSSVWEKVKPIVEGVAGGLSWLADKVGGLFGGGGKSGSVGSNAEGTNNWRGGPTWVGERGPELVNLPKGSRVLPNKESVQVAQNAARPVVQESVHNTLEKSVVYTATESNATSVLERIEKGLGVISNLVGKKAQDEETPTKAPQGRNNGPEFPPPPPPPPPPPRATGTAQGGLKVEIAKLADQIIVREDADIDRIGEAIAKRVVLAARNMVPV